MSRFLLVEMEEDLAARYTTHDGVFISCKCVNGVRKVVDLGMIDRVTLETILRSAVAGSGAQIETQNRKSKTSQ